jgi:hypothetical protein
VLEGAVSTPRHFDPSSIACRLLVERIAGSFENNVGADDRLREPHHD